jgi:hypothetical protein
VVNQYKVHPVIALAVLALAVACSSQPTTFHSAAELARAIGCQNFVMGPSPDGGDNYTERGSCTLGGSSADVYIFATDDARDSWRRVTSTGNYVAGTCYFIGVEKDLVDSTGDKIAAPIRSKEPSDDAGHAA